MAQGNTVINLKARDDRFFRAANDVVKNYKIVRRKNMEDGWLIFDVSKEEKSYQIKVHPEWKGSPQCTCPDAMDRAKSSTGGYCKHVMAVLLKNQDIKCQLLEVFI